MVDNAVFVGSRCCWIRATRFWKAGGTVSVRLPGLTVVGICDQQTLTNEGAINLIGAPACKRNFAGAGVGQPVSIRAKSQPPDLVAAGQFPEFFHNGFAVEEEFIAHNAVRDEDDEQVALDGEGV